jgi:CRISPR-associated endonuclease/helicase Cas3
MLVLVISECRGRAWQRTRRVVDAFLERAGERTWRGRLTQEGLDRLRAELSTVASRNTSVATSSVVGHRRFELEWIVGSPAPFGPDGQCTTYAGHAYNRYFETRPPLTPTMAMLNMALELAGLWHDVGKANDEFQGKLAKDLREADTIRHEILSCLVFNRVVAKLMDRPSAGPPTRDDVARAIQMAVADPFRFTSACETCDLMPAAHPEATRLVALLIATHHRLPDAKLDGTSIPDNELFLLTDHATGAKLTTPTLISLDPRVITDSLIDATTRLLPPLFTAVTDPGWRASFAFGRLALVLADRFISRQPYDALLHVGRLPKLVDLMANIAPDPSAGHRPKQSLDEHLLKVSGEAPAALSDILDLEAFGPRLMSAGLPRALRDRSTGRFAWQSAATDAVRQHRRPDAGFFGVVMAGTGTGKTRACPRILAAAGDTLRYTLCLPLRSLTLQAGMDYRSDLGLNETEVATIIGDTAVQDLFDRRQVNGGGSESSLPIAQAISTDAPPRYRVRLPSGALRHTDGDSHVARLWSSPVVVATIDQLMAVADARRTFYIVAAMRLVSADLVLDEIDSYDVEDQLAVGRLVYMAGVFGRKVLIASATLLSPHAFGLFRAYRDGYAAYSALYDKPFQIDAALFADGPSAAMIVAGEKEDAFTDASQNFRRQLADAIARRPVIRKGLILPRSTTETVENCFQTVVHAAIAIHRSRHVTDPRTRRRASAILVRFAHIKSCVRFAKWLAATIPPPDIGLKLIVHHSNHPLAVRNLIERFLDDALKRAPKDRFVHHPLIRRWLGESPYADNIMLVVSTAEDIGRDHDYDGVVIEPSSVQSLIQCAGRIDRHRLRSTDTPNVVILPTSLRILWGTARAGQIYFRPGIEGSTKAMTGIYVLSSPWLENLIVPGILDSIDARPRILEGIAGEMADLEHRKLRDYMDEGSLSLAGYHSPPAAAWLSGRHAKETPFRKGSQTLRVWLDTFDPAGLVFKQFETDTPCPTTICVSDPSVDLFRTLRLLDLTPTAALATITGSNTQPTVSVTKRFLNLSLPYYGEAAPQYTYHPDLGVHIAPSLNPGPES